MPTINLCCSISPLIPVLTDYFWTKWESFVFRIRCGSCFYFRTVTLKSSCCPFKNVKCFSLLSWISRIARSLSCASCCISLGSLRILAATLARRCQSCTSLSNSPIPQMTVILPPMPYPHNRSSKTYCQISSLVFSIHCRFATVNLLYSPSFFTYRLMVAAE